MIARGSRRWLLAGALVACACAPRSAAAEPATRARWLMGTLWTFTAEGGNAGAAIDAALDTVASLERRLSNWRDASELSRLNAAGAGVVLTTRISYNEELAEGIAMLVGALLVGSLVAWMWRAAPHMKEESC